MPVAPERRGYLPVRLPATPPPGPPAGELALQARARTVLTNSPVIAFYLRDQDVRLDRPFGLGNAEPRCTPPRCPRPLAVIEDSRLPGGVRPGPGEPRALGPIVVRVVP